MLGIPTERSMFNITICYTTRMCSQYNMSYVKKKVDDAKSSDDGYFLS